MNESRAKRSDTLDPVMRSQVESHQNLVWHWARRYRSFGAPLEDLVAAGQCGLVEAALRFDETRGVTFGTYAVWWVRKSILGALHDSNENILGTNFRRERHARLKRVREVLARELGVEPQIEDLARATGWRVRTVRRSLEPMSRLVPLETGEKMTTEQAARLSTLQHDSPLEKMILRDGVRRMVEALSALPAREMEVLFLRYGFTGEPPETLRRIAVRLGVSTERVRQIELAAIGKLRRRLCARPLVPVAAWPHLADP